MDKAAFLQAFKEIYEAPFWEVTECNEGINLKFRCEGGYCSQALCEDLFLLLRVSGLDWYIDLDAPKGQLIIRVC